MAASVIGAEVVGILARAFGALDPEVRTYVGKKCYGRHGSKHARMAGKITGVSRCRLEGCRGVALHVTWPDGKKTRPCTRGCRQYKNGDFRIGFEGMKRS